MIRNPKSIHDPWRVPSLTDAYNTQSYNKTCLQGTLRWGDTLWSGDTFSEPCPIFPMLRNLWRRDTCHVGHFLRDIVVSLKTGFTVRVHEWNKKLRASFSLIGYNVTQCILFCILWRMTLAILQKSDPDDVRQHLLWIPHSPNPSKFVTWSAKRVYGKLYLMHWNKDIPLPRITNTILWGVPLYHIYHVYNTFITHLYTFIAHHLINTHKVYIC